MTYTPQTVSELKDRFIFLSMMDENYDPGVIPSATPTSLYESTVNSVDLLKSKLGEEAYNYLISRINENWQRYSSEKIGDMQLSFGEMAHFLRQKKWTAAIYHDLSVHTEVDLPIFPD